MSHPSITFHILYSFHPFFSFLFPSSLSLLFPHFMPRPLHSLLPLHRNTTSLTHSTYPPPSLFHLPPSHSTFSILSLPLLTSHSTRSTLFSPLPLLSTTPLSSTASPFTVSNHYVSVPPKITCFCSRTGLLLRYPSL